MTSHPAGRVPRLLTAAAALALAAIVGGTVALAVPRTPAGQWIGGTVRLSSSASDSSVSITGTSGPDSFKRVLRTAIVVPRRRVADVQATFAATLLPNNLNGTNAFCFGRFTLDSQTNVDPGFRPGLVQLLGGPHSREPNAVLVAMAGFKRNIGPGTHYVNVYISSAYEGCILQERTLNVIVNIR